MKKPSFLNAGQILDFEEDGLSHLKTPEFPNTIPKVEMFEPINSGIGKETFDFPENFDHLKSGIPTFNSGKKELIPEGFTSPKDGLRLFDNSDFAPVRTIPARIVNDEEFQKLDSLSKIAISNRKKLSMAREDVEEGVERIVFSNKLNFWKKLYFEGLIGMDPTSGQLSHFSPALGASLGERGFSFGAGPNFTFDPVKQIEEAVVGIRGFLKFEFPGEKVYLQAENSGHFLKETKSHAQEAKNNAIRHVPSIGGGYVLKLRKGLGLNLMMLYQLGQSGKLERINPFQLRMGLSSLRNNSLNPYLKK